ncbi:tetratricopeptide repeat protein 13 [Rhincodon typus]|uniref:tetratricopeptide repeat protein 13 n=1 Tax=Rhincodon typus TaxID=259920 RepID=UPI00202DBFCA|nr:tetratricopeptide repeat protein 13 [Rhincodon typus]
MAPASQSVAVAVVVAQLLLFSQCRSAWAEYFSSLLSFNSNNHLQKQGCVMQSEFGKSEDFVECESSFLNPEDTDCIPSGSPPCEPVLALDTEKILSQAKVLTEQKRFPFSSIDENTNEELAFGYALIGNNLYDEAIKHFSVLLQGNPELVGAIYGRGIAYGKKGLQDIKNAELALFELNRVITLEPNAPEVFEQRAEILSPLGRISEALNDLSRAIQLRPSARLYRHRGTLYFISEDYAAAHEDFQLSLEMKKYQPIAMLYKGLTFYHRGMLKEAIDTFKDAIKLKTDFTDAYRSLGQAYRELGDFEAAMESFQKALILNQNHIQSLQLRGMMLYHHGSLQDALKDFKGCLQLEPYNEVCQYMRGLGHVAMGQFYEGIKAQTKVMLNDPLPGQKASPEFLKVKYLRAMELRAGRLANGYTFIEKMVKGETQQLLYPLFLRGQIINMRYLAYFDKILNFIKDRILVYHGTNNPKGLSEVRDALEKVKKIEDLLPIMKFNSKTRDGFTVNTKVPSLKHQGKEYDGFTITITGDRVGNMLFSVETQTTEERTRQYHDEIEALYKDLSSKGKALILSTELGETDAVCNLILSLVYYFYNLMPLSRGSSVVAYSVIMGALMASGKEITGRIPKGKLVDFEAMTTPSPEAFSKIGKNWMNLKRLKVLAARLEESEGCSVDDQTDRDILLQ